jgi:ubiquinone/menaquinone biosynthesis C-methylase UbiE
MPGPEAQAHSDDPEGSSAPSVIQRIAVGTQRRRWDHHASGWEDHAVTGLSKVIDAVVARTGRSRLGTVLDIGCGGGAVALRLAERAEKVIAVDVSPKMLDRLESRAARLGLDNFDLRSQPIESLDIPAGSLDLVVSNYALHHLLDQDKEELIKRTAIWLRPGGRLVIGDMMIGRGLSGDDRLIMAGKVRVLLARGPAGWWRVLKNAWRLFSRTVERPLPMEAWTEQLEQAGFVDVQAERVVAEAAVVSGTRP